MSRTCLFLVVLIAMVAAGAFVYGLAENDHPPLPELVTVERASEVGGFVEVPHYVAWTRRFEGMFVYLVPGIEDDPNSSKLEPAWQEVRNIWPNAKCELCGPPTNSATWRFTEIHFYLIKEVG